MAVTLTQKQAMVSEFADLAERSISVIVADYRGLPVADMTKLRKSARDAQVTMRVGRITLIRLAFKSTQFACLSEALSGPVVLFFSHEEPGAAAKILRDFMKSSEHIEVKALAMDGNLLPATQLAAMASLPSRDEAIAKLMAQMLAPITQCVRTINEPAAQLVRVLAAVRDQKQQ